MWQFDIRVLIAIAAGIVFVWLNAALIRSLHHNWGAPITAYGIAHSTFVQSALSIFWGVLGFAAMMVGREAEMALRLDRRRGLMIVVVAKLFLVDLSSIGTVARIASFLTVGLLLLITGYFAPLPPKREACDDEKSADCRLRLRWLRAARSVRRPTLRRLLARRSRSVASGRLPLVEATCRTMCIKG